MKDLIKDKFFVVGCLISLLIIGVITRLTSSLIINAGCIDMRVYGFPFVQYERCREFFTFGRILWLGMLGNILFALGFSFLSGLAFKSVWPKVRKKDELSNIKI